jgi:formylmethanofuran dehydrogenase subunit E
MNTVSGRLLHPRREIQGLLRQGETEKVLEMAGMLHGHYCPGLALGVKAVQTGFDKLGIQDNTGMEEVMAVVECNSCFADGIQFAAGCTLGNNALVYQDLGKTAVTFYRRNARNAVRLCVKSNETDSEPDAETREGNELFEKAVKRREPLTDAESKRMKELWIKRAFATVAASAESLFSISEIAAPLFAFAPIFDSQECSVCGEKVMETKTRFSNGKAVCIPCAREEYRMVVGKGIALGGGVNA